MSVKIKKTCDLSGPEVEALVLDVAKRLPPEDMIFFDLNPDDQCKSVEKAIEDYVIPRVDSEDDIWNDTDLFDFVEEIRCLGFVMHIGSETKIASSFCCSDLDNIDFVKGVMYSYYKINFDVLHDFIKNYADVTKLELMKNYFTEGSASCLL
jgi:hypothetical protein